MKNPSNSRKPLFGAAALIILALVLIPVLKRAERGEGSPSPATSADTPPPASTRGARPERGREGREADRLLAAEGVRTDVSLSIFPAKAYQRLPPPAGKAAGVPSGEAYIHIPSAGRRVAMQANQLGEFPSVETYVNDTVGIRMSLDSVKSGTPVRVVILDGGTFPDLREVARVIPVADWGGVDFEITTSANIGFHRLIVQPAGHASRIVNLNARSKSES